MVLDDHGCRVLGDHGSKVLGDHGLRVLGDHAFQGAPCAARWSAFSRRLRWSAFHAKHGPLLKLSAYE
jgi:hypothetical protein